MGFFATWRHTKALRELTERVESLERQFKAIEAEWDDTYDKIRATMQRIVKRAEVAEKLAAKNDAAQAELIPSDPAVEAEALNGASGLTPHQRAIQQDILRKRARL